MDVKSERQPKLLKQSHEEEEQIILYQLLHVHIWQQRDYSTLCIQVIFCSGNLKYCFPVH